MSLIICPHKDWIERLMRRTLATAGLITAVLVLGVTIFLIWARSSSVAEEELSQVKHYASAPTSPERDTFTVMTYNLAHLGGRDSTASAPVVSENLSRAVGLIRRADPDIIGLQEVDFRAARSGYVHQLDSIAARLKFPVAVQGVSQDNRYAPVLFTGSTVPSGQLVSGQAILSRFQVRRHLKRELRHTTSWLSNPFGPTPLIQIAAVDISGWPLLVLNVDLAGSHGETRTEQARAVNALYRRLAQYGFPMIVTASFGTLRSGTRPAKTHGIDTVPGADLVDILREGTDLQPVFSAEGARVTGQSVSTYPSNEPTEKMDYILYRPRLVVPTDARRWCGDAASPPSDHCAITMSFLLPRPKDALPDETIPDEQLPSLDSLMSP